MSRSNQSGAGRMKTFIWVVILVSFVYVAFKTVPHFINDFELRDAMKTEARFSAVQHKPEDDIREEIFKKVKELGMPIRREAIKVRASSNYVTIEVNYSVDIVLPGYTWRIDFSPAVDSRSW